MTAAHIHGPAVATEAAGPVVDTTTDSMAGSTPIPDVQAADLMAGMCYFNIHTAKYPDGEIRGYLAEVKQKKPIL